MKPIPHPGSERDRSTLPVILGLALVAATLAVYWQVQDHDFLVWDDYEYIVDNPHVRSGLSVENVIWAFTTTHTSYWHPLTWLSHMVDAEIYGLNPQGHHFNAVLFHMANAVLLFLLLKGMTGALWRSAFVAALFSLHPLRMESVAWISERKDLLSGLFWMTTLWAYVGYANRPATSRYLLTLLLFAVGLMAKPTLVTLPFVMLLLDYWPLGRSPFRPQADSNPLAASRSPVSLARLIAEKVPLFGLAALSSMVTFAAAKGIGAVAGPETLSLMPRAANALVSYVKYLWKVMWPADLAFFYPYPLAGLPGWQVIGSSCVMLGLSLLALWNARSRPYLAVGWLWYLGTLFPVIGIVQVGAQAMADRFTYIPQVGLSIAIVWAVRDFTSGWPYRREIMIFFSVVIISLCTLSTHSQLRHWKTGISLFTRALQVTSGNYTAHYHLGNEFMRQGRMEEARNHFTEALRIRPDHYLAHHNLGSVLVQQGRLDEAIGHYQAAIRIRPHDGKLYLGLGNAFSIRGSPEEAISVYREALRIDSSDYRLHTNLGYQLLQDGRAAEAIGHLSEALRINPDDRKALHNLQIARERMAR